MFYGAVALLLHQADHLGLVGLQDLREDDGLQEGSVLTAVL